MESEWKKTESGIFVPPSNEKPNVERADFAVKVAGFVPEDRAPKRGKDKEKRMVAWGI